MLPDNWNELTPMERQEARIKAWASREGKAFDCEEAAQRYERRAGRFHDVVRLRKPDRVPILLLSGNIAADHAGASYAEFFYDYEKAIAANIKFYKDFDVDYAGISNFMPGPVYERLGYKLYRWPGYNLPDHVTFQADEQQFSTMTTEEYDVLIANPERYLLSTYTPRVMSALEGFKYLPSFLGTTELPFVPFMLAAYTAPPVQAAFTALLEAAQEAARWLGANAQITAVTLSQMGLPSTMGGFTKAPFDHIGDTIRGTRNIMLDMYRNPDKLLEACDSMIGPAVDMAVGSANASGNPYSFIVMHKGADGFMSNKDFARFYWPSFKKTMLGLIENGVVPVLFVEGGYNTRLDYINEDGGFPPGTTAWLFDKTDMRAAKEKIGDWACIGGNVPASLFKAGTPQQMKDYIKGLIDDVACDGGFFLAPGAVLDNVETANLHAYFEAGKEYGGY